MVKHKKIFHFTFYEIETELIKKKINKLFNSAYEIAKKAYSPYSNFNVGAAVLLENKKIITGNNQENIAYPSGLCAERTALFYTKSKYLNQNILAIAIIALKNNEITDNPVTPCGACRQVILEYSSMQVKKIKLFLIGKHKSIFIPNAENLMPLKFSF